MRNDAATWAELSRRRFDNVVISPGPGTPERPGDFGICADALATPDLPILGVCLGHQGLAHVNGGAVGRDAGRGPRADQRRVPRRVAAVRRDPAGLRGGPLPLAAGRRELPRSCGARAWTADGTVMGLSHRERPHWGVQFHPESICTEHGRRLLENFRDLSRSSRSRRGRARRDRAASGRAGRGRPAARRSSGGASTGSSIRRPRSCASTASGASRTGSTAASSRTGCRASPTSARAAVR